MSCHLRVFVKTFATNTVVCSSCVIVETEHVLLIGWCLNFFFVGYLINVFNELLTLSEGQVLSLVLRCWACPELSLLVTRHYGERKRISHWKVGRICSCNIQFLKLSYEPLHKNLSIVAAEKLWLNTSLHQYNVQFTHFLLHPPGLTARKINGPKSQLGLLLS